MNSDLQRLIELQKIDSQIATLKAEVAATPKRVKDVETKLSSAIKRVDDAKAAIKANELARRNAEHEIQSENNKITKFREQSSSVKTNEQYKALLSEIAHAEKAIRAVEDKILEGMEDLERRQTELKSAEEALKAETAVNEKEKNEIRAKGSESEQKLTEKTAHRDELRKAIPEDILTQYERVAKGRGTGIAEARGQRCMGCQVMLRPQVWQDIKNSEGVQTCSSCSRIMYYEPANEVVAQPLPLSEAEAAAHHLEREWMFVPTLGEHGAFAVFINRKHSATMKAYDARTGTLVEKKTEKNTTFQQAFAEMLKDARNLFVDEPRLEEQYKEQLPEEVLADMQHQVPQSTGAES